jgi:Fe-S cluster assembly protein SufD
MKTIKIKKNEERVIIMDKASPANFFLEAGAKLTFILAAVKGWKEQPEIIFKLGGPGSSLQFFGFFVGKDDASFDLKITTNHLVPDSKARIYLKAIMSDSSKMDFKGDLIIEKDAIGTDTYLEHHTLLLSDKARVNTLPALEIKADDVKAGHAATIGKLDTANLFYLESRGLSSKEATKLLISAYFEDRLKLIEDKKTQDLLRSRLSKDLSTINV